eukprot:Filipodium_phascolosomae@DN2235_c0_g1_i1.p1
MKLALKAHLSAFFPLMEALHTAEEASHWFVGRPCLNLSEVCFWIQAFRARRFGLVHVLPSVLPAEYIINLTLLLRVNHLINLFFLEWNFARNLFGNIINVRTGPTEKPHVPGLVLDHKEIGACWTKKSHVAA